MNKRSEQLKQANAIAHMDPANGIRLVREARARAFFEHYRQHADFVFDVYMFWAGPGCRFKNGRLAAHKSCLPSEMEVDAFWVLHGKILQP